MSVYVDDYGFYQFLTFLVRQFLPPTISKVFTRYKIDFIILAPPREGVYNVCK